MDRFHGRDATVVAESMIKSNGFDGALKGCDTIIENCRQGAIQNEGLRRNQLNMRARNYRDVRAVVEQQKHSIEQRQAKADQEALQTSNKSAPIDDPSEERPNNNNAVY